MYEFFWNLILNFTACVLSSFNVEFPIVLDFITILFLYFIKLFGKAILLIFRIFESFGESFGIPLKQVWYSKIVVLINLISIFQLNTLFLFPQPHSKFKLPVLLIFLLSGVNKSNFLSKLIFFYFLQ